MKRSRAVTRRSAKVLSQDSSHGAPDEDAIARLTDSARLGKLVAILGTGVSMALTDSKIPALSWKGLIQNGFSHGMKKGKIPQSREPIGKTSWTPAISTRSSARQNSWGAN